MERKHSLIHCNVHSFLYTKKVKLWKLNSNIPMIKSNSFEGNADGNSKKQLAPKTEIDAVLDSMTQEASTVNNSNSSSLNVYINNNTQPFDDPIIQKMFENRVEMTDIAPEFELIRRQRMHNLLRYSKKYQKLQVAEANKNWDSSVEMFDSVFFIRSIF